TKVPWIAALHGAVLGGGAELALACRYRVARSDAKIGFPEVILGLVPGAGGTQRLSRLVGFVEALKLVPTGEAISGREAMEIGLVDEVDDDPPGFAATVDIGLLGMAVPSGELKASAVDEVHYESARAHTKKRMRGQIAPLKAIDLLRVAGTHSLEAGMKRERDVFLELRQSDQARALCHIFFAERGAKIPSDLKPEMKTPDQVAVVGGGTMGAAITYAFLNAGAEVVMLEIDADGLARASANVEALISNSLSSGRIDETAANAYRNQLTLATDYHGLGSVDLAIEAVFEDGSVKQKVLRSLEAALRPDAVIATNTSYLDVNMLAATLADPSRLVGLHFFAPAHIMKLLEIVKPEMASPKVLAMGYAVAKRLGKIPVVAGVCDGFIGNRILVRYREAADALLMDGCTPWEIDAAMVDFGYAMGPYEAQDLSGLEIAHANRRRQDHMRDPARRYISIADHVVAAGRLGRKTGVGWYQYPANGGKDIDPVIETMILQTAASAGINRRAFTQYEIQNRLVLAMINEAADILSDGIAARAADIDLVTVHGYGFARWRGGLMHYADQIGVDRLLAMLRMFSAEDPIVWRPSPMIIACAKAKTSLADWRAENN
ncbi:MAG: 3-hydroxyacyl-CoA dehydrogenase NAD-binding domain-containing protein, partial [Pseudomonadota bacterium]|nr:3-hydroxyacyl-CoA dehydrogenase NAD-binding domain-containing protein [Pseudomonadota bacterium]